MSDRWISLNEGCSELKVTAKPMCPKDLTNLIVGQVNPHAVESE